MISNKILWVVGIIFTLLLVGAALVFLKVLNPSLPTPVEQTDTNTSGPLGGSNPSTVTIPSTDTPVEAGVEAATKSGGVITVTDFKKDPETQSYPNNSLYYLSGGLTPSPTKTAFSIFYAVADKSFHITLLREPIRETRASAEQTLLKKLGITEVQACSLAIYVGVPISVNEYFAGRELGLSFCPGAEAL